MKHTFLFLLLTFLLGLTACSKPAGSNYVFTLARCTLNI